MAVSIAYNMDCIEYMRMLPDKAFNLAVVDPPYGLGMDGWPEKPNKNSKHHKKGYDRKDWDRAIPPEEYFRELERVSVHQIIWGGNYFVRHLHEGHRGWIVWDKGQHGLSMSDCELAYSSFDTQTRVVVINRVALLVEGTIHPTQKPIALYAWIYQHYAHPGDRILDTHLGSGSSRIAAYDAGLDFVGCEIDPDYFKAQEERFKERTAQENLFLQMEMLEGME